MNQPQPFMQAQTVDATTASQWLNDGAAVLIDVREVPEYDAEHIEQAHLAPLSQFYTALPDLTQEMRHIVVQCRSGKRSAQACAALQTALPQHTHIYNLTGGIIAWREAGLPVITASDPLTNE